MLHACNTCFAGNDINYYNIFGNILNTYKLHNIDIFVLFILRIFKITKVILLKLIFQNDFGVLFRHMRLPIYCVNIVI